MPRNSKKNSSKTPKKPNAVLTFFKSRRTQTVMGSFLILFSVFLLIAFISFFYTWQQDQSIIEQFANKLIVPENLLGKVGASLSYFFIYKGVGVASFCITYLVFITGLFFLFRTKLSALVIRWNWGILFLLWISISFGFVDKKYDLLAGKLVMN